MEDRCARWSVWGNWAREPVQHYGTQHQSFGFLGVDMISFTQRHPRLRVMLRGWLTRCCVMIAI